MIARDAHGRTADFLHWGFGCLRFVAILLLAGVSGAEVGNTTAPPAGQSAESKVTAALAMANIPSAHGTLRFLAPVAMTNPAATFEIVGVEKWQETSAMVRVRCVKSGDCMPFFVMLCWRNATERDAALSTPVLVREHVATRQPVRTLLVHAGEQATLVLQNDKFRIVTPVTCLENGARGQKIRVRSADHKKVRVAEVEDAGLLKGTL